MLEADAATTISHRSTESNASFNVFASFVPAHPGNYYEMLGLGRFASEHEVEKAFLKKIRNLLAPFDEGGRELPGRCKQELVSLCIARDVLKDPMSREDHDFRLLSLRRRSQKQSAPSWKWIGEIDRERMHLVEALILAELATASQLQTALELHDATAEGSFREFLVEHGFASEKSLDAAIIGRLLLKQGRLRKASLKRIFKAMATFGVDFIDSLLVTIDISIDELFALAGANNLQFMKEALASRLGKEEVRTQ